MVWAKNKNMNSVFSWHPLAWYKNKIPEMDIGTARENFRRIFLIQVWEMGDESLGSERRGGQNPKCQEF